MPNFVALGQTMWAYVEDPKKFGMLKPAPWNIGMADPTRPSPHVLPCQIWS